MKIRKAVLPAAGLGTRFLPATKSIPKEMIPIIDKPMIQYIVEECAGAGIEELILVTAPGKEAIESHFGPTNKALMQTLISQNKKDLIDVVNHASNLIKITKVIQENPLGLGHAVLTTKNAVGNEPFAVLLGDDLIVSKIPCIKQLITVFNEKMKSVIGVMQVPRDEVSKYGIVGGKSEKENLIKVDIMVEKPKIETSPSQLACPGRYVLTPAIFKILENTKPGRGGEIQLTDALSSLSQTEGLYAYTFEGKRYDTGDKLGFIEATIAFALDRPEFRNDVKNLLRKR